MLHPSSYKVLLPELMYRNLPTVASRVGDLPSSLDVRSPACITRQRTAIFLDVGRMRKVRSDAGGIGFARQRICGMAPQPG